MRHAVGTTRCHSATRSTIPPAAAKFAADGGQYETFTQGEQTWTRWRRDDDSAWRLSQGRLLHCGTTLNRLRWLATAGRYAVGFTLSSPATQNLAFGLTIGDSLSAQWDAIAGWRLTLAGNTYTDDATNGCLPTSVLLVPGDDAVLLYADGRQVFALQTEARIDGEFSLQAQGKSILPMRLPSVRHSWPSRIKTPTGRKRSIRC